MGADGEERPGGSLGDAADIADAAITRFRRLSALAVDRDRALELAVGEARHASSEQSPAAAAGPLAGHAALVAETAVRLFLAERDLAGRGEEAAAAAAAARAAEIHGPVPDGALSVTGEDGKTRVCERMCGTCIKRPGTGMDNADEVIRQNLEADALLVCHGTLPHGPYPGTPAAVCAAYWARHAAATAPGRLALAVGIALVPPPGPAPRPPCRTGAAPGTESRDSGREAG